MLIAPAVSVIIPVYNRPELLKDAAMSVLAQTEKDMELIIVDDGSEDNTVEKAEATIAAAAIPVSVIRMDHSGFPGLVRNRGAETAKGEYLAFLDSDDLWLPDKIEKQLRFFSENPEAVIVHTREKWDRNGREISQSGLKHKRSGDVFSAALKKCIIGPSTVMLKKSLFLSVGGFREDLEIAEDYELWLRITAEMEVGYIDAPLVIKRAGYAEQLSEKYGQIEIFRMKALYDLIAGDKLPDFRRTEAKEEFRRKAAIYANGCRKRDRPEEADYYEKLAQSV